MSLLLALGLISWFLRQAKERDDDSDKDALIENMTQQLTQSRDKVKEQVR